ncbi:type I-E CRISPR-associated protein Cse2/CasB [Streptomyces sp. NPDC093801]|uniref:type I-E CRISPR-associated protein Cse2/CasB n=1 Tax=Streptomyces sp. NPDC093801 TaxID=3155203 RepID=UPI00344F37E8
MTSFLTIRVPSERIAYDLRDKVCIPALTIRPDQDKRLRLLPLLETFEESEDIALAHRSPGAFTSLHHFLLGLMYAAGVFPRTEREWREWVEDCRPLDEVAKVLAGSEFDGLLDLFHPERPFGQNAGLLRFLPMHGYGPAQLDIERAGDGSQLAEHVHLHHERRPPAHEALAAMLVLHGYDTGGRMMAQNDWLGRAFTYGAFGPNALRVRNLALGRSLADTLRLNITPVARSAAGRFNFSWTDPRPDRRVFTGPAAGRARPVDGPADLHSWLGRSVALAPARQADGEIVVDRVLVGAGELMTPLPPQLLQDAVLVAGRPQQARTDRALWRTSSALYAGTDPGNAKGGSDLFSRLEGLGRRVEILSVGLLSSKSSFVGWVSETFPFVGALREELYLAATDGARWCEKAERAAAGAALVARDAAFPRARPDERKKLAARLLSAPLLWARYEELFHQLLQDVASGGCGQAARARFAAGLVTTTRASMRESLSCLPESGTGFEARLLAMARLDAALTNPRAFPPEFLEATMPTASVSPATATEGSRALAGWLAGLVSSRNHTLLKALTVAEHLYKVEAEVSATQFAETDAVKPTHLLTARLFARYHRSLPTTDPVRVFGAGDLGAACRRIGAGRERGARDPGVDRIFRLLVMTSSQVDESHLFRAVERLRAVDAVPPHWATLADDLAAWSHTGEVRERWGESFYTPAAQARRKSAVAR